MSKEYLRQYTDLPSLIHLLQSKTLTLLNPNKWDDKNDKLYMRIYKDKKNLASLFALCFTEAPETYHHWKVFASGSSGVCVYFYKTLLLQQLDSVTGIQHRQVMYKKLDALKNSPLAIKDLPFLKRYAFRDEKEYRIIFEDLTEKHEFKHFAIDTSCIAQISLSPWLAKPLKKTLINTIKSFDVSSSFKVIQTTLNENSIWMKAVQNAV